MNKLCSTTYLRSFVVYLQLLFTKVYLCEPSQVLKSGLAHTPQISLIYVRIGEITVANILQATAAFSLLRFVCRLNRSQAEEAGMKNSSNGNNRKHQNLDRSSVSSVGRALKCWAGGRGFNSRGWTNTQGLKITEKSRYSLCLFVLQAVRPSRGSDDNVKWRSRIQ